MEISFITDDRFRKLNMIFRLLGAGVLPQAATEPPAFFGKELYLSSRIFEESISIHGHQSVWDACFDVNPGMKLEEIAPKVVNMLDALDVPLKDSKDPFFTTLKDTITSGFSTNEKEIDEAMESFFRIKLPQKLVLIIDEYSQKSNSFGHKLAVNSNTGIVGYCMGADVLKKDKTEPVSVLLHELLHVLISRYRIVKRVNDNNAFEEALIRHFAPYGALTERLGFYPHYEVEHHNKELSGIDSLHDADKLVKVMAVYSKMPYGTEVWSFLAENGFDDYIDTSRLA